MKSQGWLPDDGEIVGCWKRDWSGQGDETIWDAADTLIPDLFMDKETGYDEWLFGKVSRTMARADAGETGLHEHADAMEQLKERLEARLARKAV